MLRLRASNDGTAGFVPAVPFAVGRIVGVALGILLCASAATRAESKLDPQLREELRIRGGMGNLHRRMMLAEQNAVAAVAQRDAARIYLISDYLGLAAANPVTAHHPCIDATQGLHAAVVSAGLVIDPNAMAVKIDDSRTIDLHPERAVIDKGYEDGLSKYKTNISECEQQIGVAGTRRVMPDRLPWAN